MRRRQQWEADLTVNLRCGSCRRTGGLRPDVVWFGETPYRMEEMYAALATCDLFLSIGTSGNVYPAAGFVAEARAGGARTVEPQPRAIAGTLFVRRSDPRKATEVVPAYVARLLED